MADMKRALCLMVLALSVCTAACTNPEEEKAAREAKEKMARTWCDSMGIRVTGVKCYVETCDVAPATGTPFRLDCCCGSCNLPSPATGMQ